MPSPRAWSAGCARRRRRPAAARAEVKRTHLEKSLDHYRRSRAQLDDAVVLRHTAVPEGSDEATVRQKGLRRAACAASTKRSSQVPDWVSFRFLPLKMRGGIRCAGCHFQGELMTRPHSVTGMFAATLVLWLVSIGCTLFAASTVGIDPNAGLAGQPSLLAVFAAAAAASAGVFAVWTGWRACRAQDYLVRTAR